MSIFKKARKLSHRHLSELAMMCGGMTLLLIVAVFISGGGIERTASSIAANGVSPQSLTAAIWPCSWFGDCPFASQSIYGVTANTTSVTAGQPVTLTWYAYTLSSGFPVNSCLQGYSYNSSYNCSLTGVGAVGTQCTYVPASSVETCTYDPYGTPSCTTTVTPADSCSNYYANAPSGSAVVYPSVTTTYSFCGTMYFGTLDGSNYSRYYYPTPCPSVTVTVPVAAPACLVSSFGSPWNSNSYLIYSGGKGSISNWYGRYCVTNYSGAALFIPMATAGEWNNFVARAAALSIGVVAY